MTESSPSSPIFTALQEISAKTPFRYEDYGRDLVIGKNKNGRSFAIPVRGLLEHLETVRDVPLSRRVDRWSPSGWRYQEDPWREFHKQDLPRVRLGAGAEVIRDLTTSQGRIVQLALTGVARAAGVEIHWDELPFRDEQLRRTIDYLHLHLGDSPAEEEAKMLERRPESELQPLHHDILDALLRHRNLILEGVAGCGKSHTIGELRPQFDKSWLTVFHPSTAYEEMVQGLRPVGMEFRVFEGLFLKACKEASRAPSGRFLFVADEINRANTAKVLGDLLLAIEPTKRVEPALAATILDWAGDGDEPTGVGTEFSIHLQARQARPDGSDYRKLFVVPSNLYILGTMNTTDRSVGQLDLALKRRFTNYRLEPMTVGQLVSALKEPATTVLGGQISLWGALNTALASVVGPDAVLGHSYFFEGREQLEHGAQTADVWSASLMPQLGEVLVAFGATDALDELRTHLPDEPPTWLSMRGRGLDAHPVVVPWGAAVDATASASEPPAPLASSGQI